MVITDMILRLLNPAKMEETPLDQRVDGVYMDLLNFSMTGQEQIKSEMMSDLTLRTLSKVIYAGWPKDIKAIPMWICNFLWGYRDELAIENGVIFKGRQVLIPESSHPEIL